MAVCAEYPVDTHHRGGDGKVLGIALGIGQSGAHGVASQVKLAVRDDDAEHSTGPHNAVNFTEDGKARVEAEVFQTMLGEDAANVTVRERQPTGDIPAHIDAGVPSIVEVAKTSM